MLKLYQGYRGLPYIVVVCVVWAFVALTSLAPNPRVRGEPCLAENPLDPPPVAQEGQEEAEQRAETPAEGARDEPPLTEDADGSDGNEPVEPAPGEAVSLKELTARLKKVYPDREAVIRGGDSLPRALLAFAETHAGNAELAEDVGRARQLAAEACLVVGRRAEALRIYGEMATAGPLDSHRALALYVLGEEQFLRERYLSTRRPRAADYYWDLLSQRFPQSEWATRAERPLRYLGFLKGGRPAPEFSGTFERAVPPGGSLEKQSISLEALRGKVVLIEFWTANDPERPQRVQTLAKGLASNLEEYPDLQGKVQALGVNLDTSRELFEAAIAAMGTPWPELHDGRGFRTPLAEAFAIPRVPHWVVIEASGGRVVHIGADYNQFLAAGSLALRRARGLSE